MVQRIALPAFTVTWAGVNLKLEMSTSVAGCGTAAEAEAWTAGGLFGVCPGDAP